VHSCEYDIESFGSITGVFFLIIHVSVSFSLIVQLRVDTSPTLSDLDSISEIPICTLWIE
jgi:hypothetical protein